MLFCRFEGKGLLGENLSWRNKFLLELGELEQVPFCLPQDLEKTPLGGNLFQAAAAAAVQPRVPELLIKPVVY